MVSACCETIAMPVLICAAQCFLIFFRLFIAPPSALWQQCTMHWHFSNKLNADFFSVSLHSQLAVVFTFLSTTQQQQKEANLIFVNKSALYQQ